MVFVLFVTREHFDAAGRYIPGRYDSQARIAGLKFHWGYTAYTWLTWQIVVVVISALAYSLMGTSVANVVVPIAVFLVILPTVNAALDLVSWRLSLYLGRWIVADHKWVAILTLLDLIAAVGFFTLTAVLLVVGLWFSVEYLGLQMDIRAYINHVYDKPLSDGIWVTIMLFSTIVPTAIHFTIALVAILAWARHPVLVRVVSRHLQREACWWHIWPAFYFSARRIVPLTVFVFVVYGFIYLIWFVPIGQWTYRSSVITLDWLESVRR
jgi:hypothetical protein